MRLRMASTVLLPLLLMVLLLEGCHNSPVMDDVVDSTLDGESMVQLSETLNSPLLKLIGKTISHVNKEIVKEVDNNTAYVLDLMRKERNELVSVMCSQSLCHDWTEWSACSATTVDTFGATTRSRICSKNSMTICHGSREDKTETEPRVCEGVCPQMYVMTRRGFCIKIHNETKTNWKDARNICLDESAHLININSEIKASDVNDTLTDISSEDRFWIDGTRSLPNGDWVHDYGNQSTYENWLQGEPGSTDDCKYSYYKNTGERFIAGFSCTENYYYICEYVSG